MIIKSKVIFLLGVAKRRQNYKRRYVVGIGILPLFKQSLKDLMAKKVFGNRKAALHYAEDLSEATGFELKDTNISE